MFIKSFVHTYRLLWMTAILLLAHITSVKAQILDTSTYKHYIDTFNENYEERVVNAIDNASSWQWMVNNIPFFDSPDKELEKTYYFRWWTFRKHIKNTPDGYVITEFLPDVPWSGKHNAIVCPAGHHFYEGRWLHNREYLADYAIFWFRKGGALRSYSSWLADALYNEYLVSGSKDLAVELLPDLIKNFKSWEKSNRDPNGLYWQKDGRDGMEISIGGHGYRATINSYMYGDAKAISKIAGLADKPDLKNKYDKKAQTIKELIQRSLWDEHDDFFKVLPREDKASLADVRELHGYIPWYFNLPDETYSKAWKFLMDSTAFYALYGPTTAERSHPRFMYKHEHECKWNGYSWPFATSQTLTALANLLNSYDQPYITKAEFFELLNIYNRSQRITLNGEEVPWIGESLEPFTGIWYSRQQMYKDDRDDKDRGRFYNHSSFNDLIISGLVGIRPSEGNTLVVNPLIPDGAWDYFCLDRVSYHKGMLTVYYDKTGERYRQGKGLYVLYNGEVIGSSPSLEKLTVTIPGDI